MNNIITKIKILINGFDSELDTAKEKTSELKIGQEKIRE